MIEESKNLVERNRKSLFKLKVWTKRFFYLIQMGLFILFLGGVSFIFGIALSYFGAISFLLRLLVGPLLILGALLAISGTIPWIIISGIYNSKLRIVRSNEGVEMIVDSLISHCDTKNYVEYPVVISILGDIGNKRAAPFLRIALKNEIVNVHVEAEEALAKIGEPAVEPLGQALKDEDANVRRRAVGALGKIGDERAVELLIQALKDEDEDVRWRAADALGKIGDERAVEALIPVLKDDGYAIKGDYITYVREKAAEALGKIGDKRAVEPLNQLLNDSNAHIIEVAKAAMKKIRKS